MSVDPVMRTIVCRVPFMSLTMDALVTATGLTRPKLMLSVNRLVDMSPGLVFCPPSDQGEVIAALAISFSVWQCAGHGDAAGLGFVH